MRSRSLLLAIILTGVFQFSVVANAASLCQSIFSNKAVISIVELETGLTESQRLSSKMLSDHPQFYESISPISRDGREYLEIKFKDNIGDITGGGFVGGMYGKNLPQIYQHSRIVPFLESYGIKAISETHLIVPTPKTLKSLHQKLILDGNPHSFYEPAEVKGLISPQQYLSLLAQKKWPIDATGSQEYLHDLLVHWPAAAAAPKAVVDLQTATAKIAAKLMKDKDLSKNKNVSNAVSRLAVETVSSIDGLNSIFYLSHGFGQHKQNLTTAVVGMLRRFGGYRESAEQDSLSQVEKIKLNFRARGLLREQGLSKYFSLFWRIDRKDIEREFDNAFEQRFEEL